MIFLNFKANDRLYDAKSGHGPHTPPQGRRLHLSAWKKFAFPQFATSLSGLRTLTANQGMFIHPIISPGRSRRYCLASPVKALNLTSKLLA